MTKVVTLARRRGRGQGEGSRGPGGEKTVQSAVNHATARLSTAGTGTPRLDAEVLMCFALSWPRARLFAHWDEELPSGAIEHYQQLVERRAAGEPVAYIRNLKEFLGLEFYVDPRVLIPRPETELLVTRAVAWLRAQQPGPRTVVDVGTGSGAVAIGITTHATEVRIMATDVSREALDVARINAGRNGVQIEFVQGSLLEPVSDPMELVVANLPYLSRDEYEGLLDTSIAYEPRQALTDDADGLRLFALLFDQISAKLARNGCALLEIGSGQPAELQRLAGERLPGFETAVFADYAGLPRVLQLTPSPDSVQELG